MLEIRILGIEHSRENEALKNNLLEALSQFPKGEFLIQEVKDIDEIIQEDIQGIPALFIGEQLIFQKKVPSVDEITNAIRQYRRLTAPEWQINKILVPVDFSDASLNAFNFAQHVAKKFNASITLLHCYPPTNAEAILSIPPQKQPDSLYTHQIAVEKMEKFILDRQIESEYTSIGILKKLDIEVVSGYASDCIMAFSKAPDIDLVLMANTGANGILSQLFGSVSSTIAKNAGCPVLLIPKHVRYHHFKNILYASNYESADRHTIENLLLFSNHFYGKIHFVHIEKKVSKGINVADVVFDGTIKKVKSSPNIKLYTIQSPNICDGLNNYAETHDIDLIVMVTRHRNILESWLHRSKTKEMILKAERPLLVLHYDKRKE